MEEKVEKVVSMIRLGVRKDAVESEVEDMLCGGWLVDDGSAPAEVSKEELVIRAAALKIAPPSVLERWSEDRLKAAIAKAKP